VRHRLAGRRLSRPTPQRVSLLRNLAAALIQYEQITTTEAKAKEVRSYAERLITVAKRGDLQARRLVAARLYDQRATRKLFDVIAPKYAAKTAGPASQGGYTRLYHVGFRKGDAAALARLELVPYEEPAATK
jgi:large subunit ribosomal protein L17